MPWTLNVWPNEPDFVVILGVPSGVGSCVGFGVGFGVGLGVGFAVGSKPWNVLQFDGPSRFTSGSDYVVTTCKRPSDSDRVMVEISPPGSPIIYYRWYFT